jgi:hypothetical protein
MANEREPPSGGSRSFMGKFIEKVVRENSTFRTKIWRIKYQNKFSFNHQFG